MEGAYQSSSVTQLCLTLWDPMNRSTPGLPVHHQLPEFTQSHVPVFCDPMDYSPRLLCPWNFPAKNTGVGCYFLVQGIFATQESNPCLLCRWCHPTISFSVVPFSSCPQSFPATGSFQMSQVFASGGQSIGISALASVLPKNTQDWSPLEWTGWISLRSKGLSRVFSNTTV